MALGLRDVVVLPPSPHQPCVLRLDRAVTVAAVKDRLFHRRGWRPEAQVLRLEGQRDEVSDAALLQALGGAASLRSLTLADAAGRPTRAGELIGDDGAAVVCFLRHLG